MEFKVSGHRENFLNEIEVKVEFEADPLIRFSQAKTRKGAFHKEVIL